MASRSPASLLLSCSVTLLLMLAGCNGEIHKDPACLGMTCVVGSCAMVDERPRCVCDAFDQALDEACDLLATPDTDDSRGLVGALRLEPGTVDTSSVGGMGLLEGAPSDINDYFTFDARANHTYDFRCIPSPCEAEFVDKSLQTLIAPRRSALGTSALYKAPADGKAYVRLHAKGQALRYTYELRSLGADDYPDTYAQRAAGPAPAKVFEGRLESSLDVDFIALQSSSSGSWTVECTLDGPAPAARVIDESGNRVVNWEGRGTPAAFTLTVPASSSAFLSLTAAQGIFDVREPEPATHYRCSVTGADVLQAVRTVSQPGPIEGSLESTAEVDRYQLALPRERRYALRCTDAPERCSSLRVGRTVGVSEPLPLQFFQVAEETFILYVSGAAGAYRLELVELERDAHDAAIPFALPLDGTPVPAAILAARQDVDTFSFAAEQGAAYRIELSSAEPSPFWEATLLPGPASAAAQLFVEGPLTWWDTKAASTGEQLLRVTDSLERSYSVSVLRFPADDYPDTYDSPPVIGPELVVQGTLYSPIDLDFVAVDLEARSYTATLEPAGNQFAVELLEVSPEGRVTAWLGGPTFRPTVAGRYMLRVGQSASRRDSLSYRVSIAPSP